jgi:hypothetical protein
MIAMQQRVVQELEMYDAKVKELSAKLKGAKAQEQELLATIESMSSEEGANERLAELQTQLDETQALLATETESKASLESQVAELTTALEEAKTSSNTNPSDASSEEKLIELQAQLDETQVQLEAEVEAKKELEGINVELLQDLEALQKEGGGGSNDINPEEYESMKEQIASLQTENENNVKELEDFIRQMDELTQERDSLAAQLAAGGGGGGTKAKRASASSAQDQPEETANGDQIVVKLAARADGGFTINNGGVVTKLKKSGECGVHQAGVVLGWRLCQVGKQLIMDDMSKKEIEAKILSTKNSGKKYSLIFESPSSGGSKAPPPPTAEGFESEEAPPEGALTEAEMQELLERNEALKVAIDQCIVEIDSLKAINAELEAKLAAALQDDDDDDDDDGEAPNGPVKVKLSFEDMSVEDFDEDMQGVLLSRLAELYGNIDPSSINIKAISVSQIEDD